MSIAAPDNEIAIGGFATGAAAAVAVVAGAAVGPALIGVIVPDVDCCCVPDFWSVDVAPGFVGSGCEIFAGLMPFPVARFVAADAVDLL